MHGMLELDHIALNVGDLERSLDFYGRVLGLEVLRLDAFRSGQVSFVSVRVTPETIVDLMPSNEGVREPDQGGRLNHFCLVTDALDMAALRDRLAAEGYSAHKGPVERWGARGMALSIYLRDPDGNEVELRSYAAQMPHTEPTGPSSVGARAQAEA